MIFIQRQGVTGTVPFAGDAARVTRDGVVVVDWTIGGVLRDVPQGDGYTLEVRTGATLTSDSLAVGVVVLALGQSGVQRWFSDPTAAPSPANGAYLWTASGWETASGGAAREFAATLGHDLGDVPVAFVDGAVGGSGLLPANAAGHPYWLQTGAGSLYQNALDQLHAADGGRAEFALWMQGEQDGTQGHVTAASYAAGLGTVLGEVRADLVHPHILIGGLGPTGRVGPAVGGWEQVREGQQLAAAATPGATYIPTDQTLDPADADHLTGAGREWQAHAIAVAALALLGARYTGPAVVDGTAGADRLVLGVARGIVDAHDGNDTVYGGAGDDLIRGDRGNDLLYGGDGHNALSGGQGNDVAYGGSGAGELYGDAGNDHLYGGPQADLLYGGADADTLEGGAGADRLYGDDASDTLLGGDGDDTLDGGAGADLLQGGRGNDYYAVDDAGDRVVEQPGEGTDTVVANLLVYRLPANVENLQAAGTGPFAGSGAASSNVIDAKAASSATLHGGDGADTLYGGAGNDWLYGEGGRDAVYGGAGDDYIRSLATEGPDTLDGGPGIDTFTLERTAMTRSLVIDLTIPGQQTLADGTVISGFEALRASGGSGNDSLVGGGRDDVLKGNGGVDFLFGGAGNDVLDGGAGYDHLTGGAGADTFRLDGPVAGWTDLVTDFQTGVDKVALSAAGFGVASLADVDIVDRTTGALHARPTLVVDAIHDVLSWDPDGTGPGAAVDLAHGAFTTSPGDYLLF